MRFDLTLCCYLVVTGSNQWQIQWRVFGKNTVKEEESIANFKLHLLLRALTWQIEKILNTYLSIPISLIYLLGSLC